MKNEKKLNNKGFSLVELIIVIAIMAVLIGVLAPQYMRYVERGRVSADRDNVDAIISAMQVYAVDPQVASTAAIPNGTTLTINRSGVDGTVHANVAAALTNAGLPATPPALTNRNTFDQVVITYTADGTNFTVTAAYTNGGTAVTF
ncbi:MAG: prepilin-type N-terminal cleavage/methylation domain-containing protein [Acetatifactor sp.]